jgi:hypothetical protein
MNAMPYGARLISVAFAVSVVAVACTSSGSDTTSSSVSPRLVTTLSVTDAVEGVDDPTTTLSPPKTTLSAPDYTIVHRIEGEAGDTVVVLLDPSTYDSLTDLDLYDLIAEVVELFPPIAAVHVVDDASAATIVANPDASEAEKEASAANYLARLDDGVRIIYLGPLAAAGTAVLGS